jgi:hypothetical protein
VQMGFLFWTIASDCPDLSCFAQDRLSKPVGICTFAGVKIARHLQVVPAISEAGAGKKAAMPVPELTGYQRMNLRNALMSLQVAALFSMHCTAHAVLLANVTSSVCQLLTTVRNLCE